MLYRAYRGVKATTPIFRINSIAVLVLEYRGVGAD